MKLDAYSHIFPPAYFERMRILAEGPGRDQALAHLPVLYDLDARIKMMREFPGYQQILTLSLPAIEFITGPEESPALARLANDGMAEIVARHPDLFPAFVASLPMNNVAGGARRDGPRDRASSARRASRSSPTSTAAPLDEPEF